MHIKLDLWSTAQLDAFGDFCKALATAQRSDEAEKRKHADVLPGLGGISRSPDVAWKTTAAEDKPSDTYSWSQVAAVEKDGAVDIVSTRQDADAPKRERGQPSPGKARRTKAEIAEDEAADTAGVTEQAQSISSGEERVGPEDDAETQAQDEADEQAEVEASRDPEEPLTVEDLKSAMSAYVTKFGMPATQEDGVNIFASALGNPPAGEAAWKMTLVANAGQDKLKKAIDAWTAAAAAGERFGA
jgi:hypothetical protein